MALWIEHRDSDGKLVDRARFEHGCAVLENMSDTDGGVPLDLTPDEARVLARMSSHLPPEKRSWALRIEFSS
jgi:hypothetical protein